MTYEFEKTKLKSHVTGFDYPFRPYVYFVSSHRDVARNLLNVVNFAGYKELMYFDTVSSAWNHIKKQDLKASNALIVSSILEYDNDSVPVNDLEFCHTKGLRTDIVDKIGNTRTLQSFQLTTRVRQNYSNMNCLVLGEPLHGDLELTYSLGADFLYTNKNPMRMAFDIFEYLRNINTDLFER